jgi:outer membrane protein assembly factor BamD (BamD/ComL family)
MGTGFSMPHLGSFRARARFVPHFCAALAVLCAAPARPARAVWPWSSNSATEAVGTAQWWKKHKEMAVFEPGKGYKVEGVDGYFDGFGRPIASPVAVENVLAAGDKKDEIGLLPGLDPRVQFGKMKQAVGLGPNEQFARQAYTEGDRLFREKKYKAAAEHFQKAIARGPHSAIEQDAMFMLAESYFFDDRYIKARDAYDGLVKEHANTRYMDTVIDREWKIARYWEERDEHNPDWPLTPNVYDKTRPWFDTIGHAIKTYESIRLNDPTGPRADDAIMATGNIYFKRGRFEDADYNYTLLRQEYPRSELQFEAHLLGLQAKLRKYQGEDYDGTPLEEAKTLVKQLNSQFSGRLSKEEKDRLATVEGQLNHEVATRDYRMAAYYDKKKDYGAARFYYAEVIKKYPDTELSKQARTRVSEITGEPDEPPKKLAFLLDRLPESRERTRVARIPELQKGGTRLAEVPDTSGTTVGNAEPTTVTK